MKLNKYLSNVKAKKNKLKILLLRVPNSIYSKYNTKVQIVEEWDVCRPHISSL